MIYIVSLLTIQTVCRPCINNRQSLLDRPMNDSVDIGILNEGAGRWRIDRALPDKGRKRRVFANLPVRNLLYRGRDWWKKKRKEKNSKALLGCRWNFWASFTHSAKVNYRSIPLLPHLPHNFLSPTDPLSFSETGSRSLCSLHHHSKRAAQYLRL